MTMISNKPKPVAFTIREGGEWYDWKEGRGIIYGETKMAAIRFDDNTIFDIVIGDWRGYVDPEQARRERLEQNIIDEILARNCADSANVSCSLDSLRRCIRAELKAWTIRETPK